MLPVLRSPTNRAILIVGLVCVVCSLTVSAEGGRICGSRLTTMLMKICTPKDALEPCFKGQYANLDVNKRKHWLLPKWMLKGDQLRDIKRSASGVATQCCEHGCDYKYMKSFCCDS